MPEKLCFGEDLPELTSLKSLVVNVTRSGCAAAMFPLSVSYNKSEMESFGKQCNHHVIQLRQFSSHLAGLFLQSLLECVNSPHSNCKQIALLI